MSSLSTLTRSADTARALRDSCSSVGTGRFGWHSISAALTGYFAVGDLGQLAVPVRFAGKNGVRHFHAGCGPEPTHWDPGGTITEETYTLTQLVGGGPGALIPSRRHGCADEFAEWLPADARTELAALADARLLTRPWRSAAYSTARRGYQVMPYESTPMTSGLLERLAGDVERYARAYPARAHMGSLAGELQKVLTGWRELLAQRDEVVAADPHTPVLTWQQQLGLPMLSGSPRQVRWAERIRFDLYHGGAGAGPDVLRQLFVRESAAGVWIALDQQGTGDLLGDWLDLRERAAEVAARRARLDSAWGDGGRSW